MQFNVRLQTTVGGCDEAIRSEFLRVCRGENRDRTGRIQVDLTVGFPCAQLYRPVQDHAITGILFASYDRIQSSDEVNTSTSVQVPSNSNLIVGFNTNF